MGITSDVFLEDRPRKEDISAPDFKHHHLCMLTPWWAPFLQLLLHISYAIRGSFSCSKSQLRAWKCISKRRNPVHTWKSAKRRQQLLLCVKDKRYQVSGTQRLIAWGWEGELSRTQRPHRKENKESRGLAARNKVMAAPLEMCWTTELHFTLLCDQYQPVS